jgi:UDP-glucose 4-epimerase
MKILVTGGAGFIGSHLVERMLQDHEIMVIDNLSEGKYEQVDDRAFFEEADVRNRSEFKEVVESFNPEMVYHLAVYNDAMGSIEQEKKAIDVNVHGTVNVLETCVENKVRKIVYASSGGLSYGDAESVPTREDHNTNPVYPYGVTKNCGTTFIQDYGRRKNIDYAICRLGSVYGPRASGGVVKKVLQKLENNEKPVVYGDGTQTRDFIYVTDVVRGLEKAKAEEGVFNLGTGIQTSVNEIITEIMENLNYHKSIKYEDRWEGDINQCQLSIEKAERQLNWHPQISLETGIEKCIDFYT